MKKSHFIMLCNLVYFFPQVHGFMNVECVSGIFALLEYVIYIQVSLVSLIIQSTNSSQ